MSDIYSSIDISIGFVVTRYNDLKSLNSEHELLKLIEIKGDCSFSVKDDSIETFKKKYQNDQESASLRGQIRTLLMLEKDLEKAVKEELSKKRIGLSKKLEESNPGIVRLL